VESAREIEMKDIRWFHSMELEPGVHTISPAETEKLRTREEAYFKRVDLKGKSLLDIGAWDGNFSFAAKRHGAVRVLATDHFCWSGAGWGTKDGFDFANAKMKAGVESLEIDVPDISPGHVGTFDVVLFLGVLYHLRHPLLGLERAADAAARDGLLSGSGAEQRPHQLVGTERSVRDGYAEGRRLPGYRAVRQPSAQEARALRGAPVE